MKLSREDDQLLEKAAAVAYAEVEDSAGISHLPRAKQVFVIIHSVQPVIDNGGFQYLFESDWPGTPSYSIFAEAYRAIGAEEVAALLEEAVGTFPFADAHLQREQRVAYLRAHCVEAESRMAKLSDRAMAASDDVFARLAGYVRAHKTEFGLA